MDLATEDRTAAAAVPRGACEKLLANQVIENFRVELLLNFITCVRARKDL